MFSEDDSAVEVSSNISHHALNRDVSMPIPKRSCVTTATQAAIDDGVAAAEAGNWMGAIAALVQAVRLDEANAPAFDMLSQVYLEAAAESHRVVEPVTGDPIAVPPTAEAAADETVDVAKPTIPLEFKAVQAAEAAVGLRPLVHEHHVTLGRAQLAFGEPHAALASFQRAKALLIGDTGGSAVVASTETPAEEAGGASGSAAAVISAVPAATGCAAAAASSDNAIADYSCIPGADIARSLPDDVAATLEGLDGDIADAQRAVAWLQRMLPGATRIPAVAIRVTPGSLPDSGGAETFCGDHAHGGCGNIRGAGGIAVAESSGSVAPSGAPVLASSAGCVR
jgi:hypothetical protein